MDPSIMSHEGLSSICRICLENGATYLIFKDINEENSIYHKLRECFKEKVEDINGYPRYICESCKNTLDVVYVFLNKFKESYRQLNDGLGYLKQEDNNDACSDFETDQLAETEIKLKSIKSEPKTYLDGVEETEDFTELWQPIESSKKTSKKYKRTSIKSEKDQAKAKRLQTSNITNRLATSILEGEFIWNGETWSLKCSQFKLPRVKEELDKPKKRNNRLKLPRKPTVKQPKLCDMCGEIFKTQCKLSIHRSKVHFSAPKSCTQCPRVCSSEENLLRHIKRKHSVNKDFVCDVCSRCFAYKGELTNHVSKVHNNQPKRKYVCKFCGKNYTHHKSVLIHERSAHTGERPAECSVCFKGFFHEEYLKEHMRLHTGEAPYKCPVCDRGYAQRGNMKSHLRIHRITEVDAATISKLKPNYLKLLKI